MHDPWTDGTDYDAFVGRWSRKAAPEFLGWLGAGPGLDWLDLGCGTGALTDAILRDAAPATVTGIDPAPAFLGVARARVNDPRASFAEGTGGAVPLPDNAADVAVSALVLNFIPDLAGALADLRRVLRPGGTLAGYVWDYAGHAQFIRYFWDAALEIDPDGATPLDEGARFALCAPGPLSTALETAGFTGVEVAALDIATAWPSFQDYWAPFTAGTGPAPGYCAGLDQARRADLRAVLQRRVPADADGRVLMAARVWAVRSSA